MAKHEERYQHERLYTQVRHRPCLEAALVETSVLSPAALLSLARYKNNYQAGCTTHELSSHPRSPSDPTLELEHDGAAPSTTRDKRRLQIRGRTSSQLKDVDHEEA